jgi:surface antigen
MLAKSLTVLGKLLTVAVLTSSATVNAQSWDRPLYQYQYGISSSVEIIFGSARMLFSNLNKEDKAQHQRAVYHALNMLDNGEVVSWHSDDRSRNGHVQIMATTSKNGEICRRVYSIITTQRNQRAFEEWACFKNSNNAWRFSDK